VIRSWDQPAARETQTGPFGVTVRFVDPVVQTAMKLVLESEAARDATGLLARTPSQAHGVAVSRQRLAHIQPTGDYW
jgi:hypothetical protein